MSLQGGRQLTRPNVRAWVTDEPERLHGLTLIDLEAVSWIDSVGLVLVAIQIDAARTAGREILFTMPASPDVASYMSRMGLADFLERNGLPTDGFPVVRHRDRRDRLLELTVCEGNVDYSDVADLVYQKIAGMGYYPEVAPAVYAGLMELGENVLEHSGAPRGFTAAQAYRLGEADEYLVFSVGDAGVGLRASLSSLGPADDVSAVEMALELGVSGTGDPARGQGLPTVVDLATEVRGRASLISGTAVRDIWWRGGRTRKMSQMPGTVMGCRLPCQPGR